MEKLLPIYIPIGYLFSKGWSSNTQKQDIVDWRSNNKDLRKIGETNLLTGGGILLTLIGGLSSLFSQGKNTFSSLLALIGLGAVGFGLFTGPDFSSKNEAQIAPPPVREPQTNECFQELNHLQSNELIAILINKPKQKENTVKRRGTAAIILADRKVKEAIKPLVDCLKENMKTLIPKIKEALSKIGLDEAHKEIVLKKLAKLIEKDNFRLGQDALEIKKNAAAIVKNISKTQEN